MVAPFVNPDIASKLGSLGSGGNIFAQSLLTGVAPGQPQTASPAVTSQTSTRPTAGPSGGPVPRPIPQTPPTASPPPVQSGAKSLLGQ